MSKYYKGLIFFELPKTDIHTKQITAEDIQYYDVENAIQMIKFKHKSKDIICAEFPFNTMEVKNVYVVLHIA